MRLATVAVLAIAFAVAQQGRIGVIPVALHDPDMNPAWIWSVDELESWNGRALPFVIERLGLPDTLDEYAPTLPEDGIWRGMQERLDTIAPGYGDWTRVMQWHRDGVNHTVFLIILRQQWIVLDAVAWADGVEF